jgi:hypothetical protein
VAGQSRRWGGLSTKAQVERHGVPGRGRPRGTRIAPNPAPPPTSYYSCATAVLTASVRVNATQLCACNLAQFGAGESRSVAGCGLAGATQLQPPPHLTAFCCKKSRNCSSALGSERSVKNCFTSRVSCSAHTHSVRLPCAHGCTLPSSGPCCSSDNPVGSSAPGHSRWSRCGWLT